MPNRRKCSLLLLCAGNRLVLDFSSRAARKKLRLESDTRSFLCDEPCHNAYDRILARVHFQDSSDLPRAFKREILP